MFWLSYEASVHLRGDSSDWGWTCAWIDGSSFGGKGIKVEVDDHDQVFKDLRIVYKNVKYKTIGEWLVLFVLFTLGTLLSPSASISMSNRLLKLLITTKDALGDLDWSSFIIEELSQEINEFKKDSHTSKCK